MSIRWHGTVVDCRDIAAQARWWADVLDWRIAYEEDDAVVVVPPSAERCPELVFVRVPEGKTVKNRLHIDLAPEPGDDYEEQVQRLIDRGATRINIGQDESQVPWIVLADPEGNEFCLLTPRE